MAGPSQVHIRVLDGDLGGKLPSMKPTDFVVPKSYTLESTVAAVYDRVKGKRLARLTIICHGQGVLVHGDLEVGSGKTVVLPDITKSHPGQAVCKIYGGYGLFLGKEVLTLANASTFGQLKGWFTSTGLIEICGCAAADTGPTVGPLSGDGPKLMRALAAATGASVRAPVRLQTVTQNWYLGIADRTAFVGPTYLFTPTGQQTLDAACY